MANAPEADSRDPKALERIQKRRAVDAELLRERKARRAAKRETEDDAGGSTSDETAADETAADLGGDSASEVEDLTQ